MEKHFEELLEKQKTLEGKLHILYLAKVELSNELKELFDSGSENEERIKAIRLELRDIESKAVEVDKKLCEIDKKVQK